MSGMGDEIEKAIDEALQTPQSFGVDGLNQSNRSASDIIALAEYKRKLSGRNRGGSPLAGLISHAIVPGPTGRF